MLRSDLKVYVHLIIIIALEVKEISTLNSLNYLLPQGSQDAREVSQAEDNEHRSFVLLVSPRRVR